MTDTEAARFAYWLDWARTLEPWQWEKVAETPGLSETARAALAQARRERDDRR